MKVVIYTQIRENYGDEFSPFWKSKGGNTYVIRNLSEAQVAKVQERGIPTLTALINTKNPVFEEMVNGFNVVEDGLEESEPWETVTQLSWENGRWVALEEIENGEYGYLRKEIDKKVVTYEMGMGGERRDAKVVYILKDGRKVDSDQLADILNETV